MAMLALDSDVCIYAVRATPWTNSVRGLMSEEPASLVASVLVPVEALARPLRLGDADDYQRLTALLQLVTLVEVSRAVAATAVMLEVKYGLRSIDAIHLASAVNAGAERFLTNNRKDFDAARIAEIAVVHPEVGSPLP